MKSNMNRKEHLIIAQLKDHLEHMRIRSEGQGAYLRYTIINDVNRANELLNKLK